MQREKGMHGSVGTQNEKLIHAALKNYYAPFSDEQEIKIGNYFADAVNENGIFEIQTQHLYKLKEKLRVFLEFSRVTVVHPIVRECKTFFINENSGEVVKESTRKSRSFLDTFEELYSIRDFLTDDNLKIILALLNIEKRVYFSGNEPPNLTRKAARKKCRIETFPTELVDEILLDIQSDYSRFVPEDLPDTFIKKEFCKSSKESASSMRLEVLRTVGLIEHIGNQGRYYLYKCRG